MLARHDLHAIGLNALKDAHRDGDAAAYSLRSTSGTMSREPVLVARRRVPPGREPYDFYPGCRAIIVFVGGFSTRLRLLCDLLIDCPPQGRRILALGAEDFAGLDLLLQSFRPDCFSGVPPFIAKALGHVRNAGVCAGIRAVHMHGEPFTEEVEAHFYERLPNAVFMDIYATAEAGRLSSHTCGYLPYSTFHPLPEVRVEVDAPDTAGVGELLVSTPWSRSVRLERYRTGDLGRIITTACLCGSPDTFELLGRRDAEMVHLLGLTLSREMFDRVAREMADYLSDYRVAVREFYRESILAGEIILEVVATPLLASRPAPEQFLADAFRTRLFVTSTRTLAAISASEAPITLLVKLVPPFPPEAKTVRLKKVR